MRGVRAEMPCPLAALARAGCVRDPAQVAVVEPQTDPDSVADGQSWGMVPAPPAGLAAEIIGKLRRGYVREPSVAVEIEACRPFFILGEVAASSQYPHVPSMSVESAVAIAGGFSPRARRDRVTLTHTGHAGSSRMLVPPGTALGPGDTVLAGERWF